MAHPNLKIPDGSGEECGRGHACGFCPQEQTCTLDKRAHNKTLVEARLGEIGQIVLVLGNKGGVGKSTVSANLAAGLAARGFRVGMADADIHGPNQSRYFGFAGEHIRVDARGLAPKHFTDPALRHGLRVGSLAFMLQDDDAPVVWRDAYKHDFVHHLMGSFDWGALDFLIVDMPPGTGNELITLTDLLEGCDVGALLVTTPQAVAQMDSLKAARFCLERGLPVIGCVENMAGVVCPHCAGAFHLFPEAGLGEKLTALGIRRLARLPLDPAIAAGSDEGRPVALDPDAAPPVAEALAAIVGACAALGSAGFQDAAVRSLDAAFAENLEDKDLARALAALPEAEREQIGRALAEALTEESGRLHSAASAPGGKA
ncbi:P-loop NTPase [Rhodovulum sulfidophilum]|uniref:P-loop NTPase n=1 Tax=Rhodovulum sulfidophilum TaxID=35806 RepID=UPI0019268BA0|nr:P-loop NTPase [Rhodovulum sulfidophilum]MBL3586808.1 P-loop NTPase [Rhodovulum sulfidophilum]